ncbi:hypothetical protein MFUL124B02_21165 [Myxococcus fulvus 124B02]|nr:hypothetical protein MFUL124B02_21165 [Myxococcus fulvus 124B02]
MRGRLEHFFDADFSDVRIQVGTEALKHGALAFTAGSDVHFAPGCYAPWTRWGQHLLAHELTHVLQQRTLVTAHLDDGVLEAPELEMEAERMGAAFARGAPAPSRLAPASTLIRRGASGPSILQCYNIKKIYALANVRLPDTDVFEDLQFIHDALNTPQRMHVYFDFVNGLIKHRVKDLGWTPTESLVLTFKESVEQVRVKLPKLFEPAPSEMDFLRTMRGIRRPFHDVSAGLFHGEYEHSLQLDFIRRNFEFKHAYESTELKTDFRTVWDTLFDERYVIKVPEGARGGKELILSLWDVVMDIQGGFLQKSGPKGLSGLPTEQEPLTKEDLYQGSFGTSATLMHHAFGAYGLGLKTPPDYAPITGLSFGVLAKRYPYLAAAIIDRHMKRKLEAIKKSGSPDLGIDGYHEKHHSIEAKEARKKAVREVLAQLNTGEDVDWQVKPSRRTGDDTTKARPNTGLS